MAYNLKAASFKPSRTHVFHTVYENFFLLVHYRLGFRKFMVNLSLGIRDTKSKLIQCYRSVDYGRFFSLTQFEVIKKTN